jgi:lipopolysaccharide transport system ATP-binding protein
MSLIVRVENVGKRYRLGGLHPGYVTLREAVGTALLAPLRRRSSRRGASPPPEPERDFWALREVSFEVSEGELIGVIGRNGAGKSTLLKILSRVTRPTTGSADIYGRVGSLLEVGTGFHPDLTGRENVYLNGAILGMRREEIARKFDEIVAFAEIERHINTPVKWYSSGMYVRLAFSVAAHLEPEVLIMDEVLAVGDARFQQKCLDKMREIREGGHTIFFVSHNLESVARLCRRALLLEGGRLVADGPAREVVAAYAGAGRDAASERVWAAHEAPGDSVARLRRVRAVSEQGADAAAFGAYPTACAANAPALAAGRPFRIEITFEVLEPGHTVAPGIDVYTGQDLHLFGSHGAEEASEARPLSPGAYTSTVAVPGDLAPGGDLTVHVSLVSGPAASVTHAHEREALSLRIADAEKSDTADRGPSSALLRPRLGWTTSAASDL